MIVVCCQCGRVRDAQGWRAMNPAESRNARKSHTYCPPCLDAALAALEEQFRERDARRHPSGRAPAVNP